MDVAGPAELVVVGDGTDDLSLADLLADLHVAGPQVREEVLLAVVAFDVHRPSQRSPGTLHGTERGIVPGELEDLPRDRSHGVRPCRSHEVMRGIARQPRSLMQPAFALPARDHRIAGARVRADPGAGGNLARGST